MSAGEKALSLVKTVFTIKDQIEAMSRDVSALGERVTRLSESHVALRERVSRIEGLIEGAAMARNGQAPRIEG
jgi:predicted  nucleic acid-binding Zn-ribbon protein